MSRIPNYGKGLVSVSERELENLEVVIDLPEKITVIVNKELLSESFSHPMLPETALELQKLSSHPNVNFHQVEEVAKNDQEIAARIIAVSNSALFARGQPVWNLNSAIRKLGLQEVRNIAFEMVAKSQLFKVEEYINRMRELFISAKVSGLFAKEICRIVQMESDLAYLCGLLHDVGEAIILSIIAKYFKVHSNTIPHIEDTKMAVEKLHERAGALICKNWGLPITISDAIMNHHNPINAQYSSQMALVLAITDRMLEHAGIGYEPRKIIPEKEELFYRFNLFPEQINEIAQYAEYISNNINQL